MPNNLKYRQIKAFCLAIEAGSFHAAAQAMHVTQPSFTLLIQNLEADLGMQLFERTTRRNTPTAGALSFYRNVARPLQDLEDAYRHARSEGAGLIGRLSIGTVPSLSFGFLAPILGQFQQRFPDVQVFMSEQRGDEVLAAVRSNQVELGIGRLPAPQPDLAFSPLFRDRLVVAAPLGHPLLGQPALRWKDLTQHKLILIGGGATEQQVRAAQPSAAHRLEVTHLATAVALARHGMGIAVVPTSAIDGLKVDGLGFASIEEETAYRQLSAIHRRQRKLSVPARQFLALVAAHAGQAMESWEARFLEQRQGTAAVRRP